MVSVIIPALNEAASLSATLETLLQMPAVDEIIVVDGGSDDGTMAVAQGLGVKTVLAERGRGAQLHAGAVLSQGAILWFVHSDTLPEPFAAQQLAEALREPGVIGGNFGVVFSGSGAGAHFLNWFYPKLRWLGLCYGDSAFFVRRAAYEAAGGFRALSLFEDVDLLRRLRRQGRFVHLPALVQTSARRFEGRWFGLIFMRWCILQIGYWLGWRPRVPARWYPDVR